MKRLPRRKVLISAVATATVAATAVSVLAIGNANADAADTFPSEDACEVENNSMPKGDCGDFKQIFAENFNGDTVPVGAFSDCDHNVDTPEAYCGGLSEYGSYKDDWWAYPNGWDDTAKSGADGNDGAPYGGTYRADKTVSVGNGYDGTGTMKVDMYRPESGEDNYVGAVVPRKCMDRAYGKYTERFKVTKDDGGFKSAHLFYDDGYEMDFPENDYGADISAYTHPGEDNFDSGVPWKGKAHTTSIEWTPGHVKYYLDGKLIGDATKDIPDIKMSWILQNESSILGPYAERGARAALETTWLTCYSYNP